MSAVGVMVLLEVANVQWNIFSVFPGWEIRAGNMTRRRSIYTFLCGTSDPSLLLVILAAFRVLDTIMGYDRSKCVIELDQFDDSKI
jgi:hypothetical protein